MTAIQIANGIGYDIYSKVYITDCVIAEDGSYTGQLLDPLATVEQLHAIISDMTTRNIASLTTETGNAPVTQQKILGTVQHVTGYLQQQLSYISSLAKSIESGVAASLPTLNMVKNGLVASLGGLHPTVLTAIDKLTEVVVPAADLAEVKAVENVIEAVAKVTSEIETAISGNDTAPAK